jgi:osmotically-inducible protein OsmY
VHPQARAGAYSAPPPSGCQSPTTKIKLALLTTHDVSSNAIHVDTINQRVTLHGKVRTQAEKSRAETVARSVDGVRQVRDLLQIVPRRDEKPVDVSDDRVEKSVAQMLKEEPSLKDSSISVKSVDKGVVLLSGKTDSLGDYLLAVESTQAMPGVRRVASEIQAPQGTLDWKERGGSTHSDTYLTAATKLRLIRNPDVSVLDVNVDSHKGVVTLFGTVPTAVARAAAEADARKVDGVTHVQNELQVVRGSREKLVKADDKIVRSAVEAAFKEDGVEHVDINVENGAVRLSGTVPTVWVQIKAATLARSVPGVRLVNDDLHVGQ